MGISWLRGTILPESYLLNPSQIEGSVRYDLGNYGRMIGDVLLSNGTHDNHTLVKDGWCWWYRKYAPRDTVLERLEAEVRESKKGLWVAPVQVPPWEWRQGSKIRN
jgi:endonuclease YncB( thermonuclease family)